MSPAVLRELSLLFEREADPNDCLDDYLREPYHEVPQPARREQDRLREIAAELATMADGQRGAA